MSRDKSKSGSLRLKERGSSSFNAKHDNDPFRERLAQILKEKKRDQESQRQKALEMEQSLGQVQIDTKIRHMMRAQQRVAEAVKKESDTRI